MYNIFDSKTANNRAVMDPQLTLHPTRTTGEAPGHPYAAWRLQELVRSHTFKKGSMCPMCLCRLLQRGEHNLLPTAS